MSWLTLLLLLQTPKTERLVMLPWAGTGVASGVSDFAGSRFAELLQERGQAVTTTEQMTAVLGFERQKQLLQCGDESRACLVELSSAMGARLLVLGRVTKLGARVELDVRVLDASTVQRVAGARRTAETEERLGDELGPMAQIVIAQLRGEPVPTNLTASAPTAPKPTPHSKLGPTLTLSAGVAALVVGIVCIAWGQAQINRATGDRLGLIEARTVTTTGQNVRGLGVGLGLVGLAAGIVGAVWWFSLSDSPVALMIGPTAAAVQVRF